MARDILVVGATGQQGRAVIDALYMSTSRRKESRILALTRESSSPKAQALHAAYPDLTLIEGNTSNPEPIFTANPTISAIFLVTSPPHDEEQGLPLIKAAVAPNSHVDQIVFSSVDRGGDEASWSEPTEIPHFAAKHRIELQLRQLCDEAGKRWTILRPTGFMDTYNPGFFGKFMASLWATALPAEHRMQLISTHDIGIFAAKALEDPEQWAGRAVALAGDNLSINDMRQVFRQTVGEDLPQTYSILALPALWWVEDAKKSFQWFERAGYRANIDTLRQEEPKLQTFRTWLQESSGWKTKVLQ